MIRPTPYNMLACIVFLTAFVVTDPTLAKGKTIQDDVTQSITDVGVGADSAGWAKCGPLRIGALDLKPLMYLEGGVAKGSLMELQRELMEEAGLEYTQRFLPLGRLYNELELDGGTIDAWITVRIATAAQLGFPVEPTLFLPLELSMFGLAGSDPPKLMEFGEKGLITVIGFRFNGVIDRLKQRLPNLKVMAAHGHLSAFRMLKAGRSRFLIDYHLAGMDAAQSLGIGDVVHTTIYKQPTFLYISRNVPDAAALLERLGKASERILARRAAEKALEAAGR